MIKVFMEESRAIHRVRLLEPIVDYNSYEKILSAMTIAPGKYIGDKNPCFIIAEIGQNHMGDINIAEKLIDIAVDCEVDCVKFQKSDINARFNGAAQDQPYTSEHAFGDTYGQHRRYLEFTNEEFVRLQNYAVNKGVIFTASGMDKPSVDFLHSIHVPFFKIGSADCVNYPLLTHTALYKKPMVISTGMHNLSAINKMYNYLRLINTNIALLQCTSSYPSPIDEINLNVMETYRTRFPFAVVGYSGHEIGTGISIAAVALGAKILERHITLSHDLKGTDHTCSLEPDELRHLVYEVRRVEKALGSNLKSVQESEALCMEKLAKTVVSTRDLKAGTILEREMFDLKVAIPKGWEAHNAYELIGRRLMNDIPCDGTISKNDIYFKGDDDDDDDDDYD